MLDRVRMSETEDHDGILPLVGAGISVRRNGRNLLDNVSLTFDGPAITALLGSNGAGKTMLLRVLANLVEPDTGTVQWGGRSPDAARAPRLGFVFQKPVMLRRSVLANMKYVLAAVGHDRASRTDRAWKALRWASLDRLASTPARLLSGGEQQRLAIARVMATEPEIMFLDEPSSGLDLASTALIEMLMRGAASRGTKVVVVTHDIAQARRLADDVIFLHQGQVLEHGPADSFFDAPKSKQARDYLAGRIPDSPTL